MKSEEFMYNLGGAAPTAWLKLQARRNEALSIRALAQTLVAHARSTQARSKQTKPDGYKNLMPATISSDARRSTADGDGTFDFVPEKFTVEEAVTVRRKAGLKSEGAKSMLKVWRSRGYIDTADNEHFHKIDTNKKRKG